MDTEESTAGQLQWIPMVIKCDKTRAKKRATNPEKLEY